MHWYTLTPFNPQTFNNTNAFGAEQDGFRSHLLSLNGHTIAAALRNLLPNALVTLRGPFFCRNNTLYFPSPLHFRTNQVLVPGVWLCPQQADAQQASVQKSGIQQAGVQKSGIHKTTAQTAEASCIDRSILWDKRKPAPLVAIDSQRERNREFGQERSDRALVPPSDDRIFLSYRVFLGLMQHPVQDSQYFLEQALGTALEEQSWAIEMQCHRLMDAAFDVASDTGQNQEQNQSGIRQTIHFNSGWKIAIALDDMTAQKLKQLGEVLLIRLSETEQFWLEPQDEPFQQQWELLQKQSEENRKRAEQPLNQDPEAARVLAYLATPGVFERKQNGVALCRNFPWEWDLAYPADRNQPRGPLVSLATTQLVPMNCCCLSTAAEKDILAVQVFAVPPGTVYYLEHPADLFQDQPSLGNGRPNKIHLWRQLGYSELLWLRYAD